jgi:AraC-like DNA-binding protein
MKKDNSAHFKQSTLLPWIEMRAANRSTACYEAHSHDEFSFGIIEQGIADYRNRHRTHRISTGDIVTINPADVHACNPEVGTWSYTMLFVETKTMGQVQQEISNNFTQDYTPFLNDLEKNTLLRHRFRSLFSALQEETSALQAQHSFYEFIEASLAIEPQTREKARKALPNLTRVREKLSDELGHTHQLEELAKEADMSRYQLLRAFKTQYGLPPHAYLMDERVKRAKVMLKAGQSISDIALSLGFSDQAHFQRQFKKKLAVTPKFYQSHFV